MKTTKVSLANIQGKLSRAEMKNIMAGSGSDSGCSGNCNYQWKDAKGVSHTTAGTCNTTQNGLCYCSSGGGSCS